MPDQLINTFIQLIKIPSPTGQVDEFSNYLFNALKKFSFLSVTKDNYQNIIARTKSFDKEKSLLITTHIDTVQNGVNINPIISKNTIKSDGKTILGADPKCGIALVLNILENFTQERKEPINLEFIFSTNEEEGDHTLQFADIKSKKAIVLDNASRIDDLIYQGPFAKVFEIKVIGKEVYAQIDYNKGANAILSLSEIISQLKWGFYADGCVANTGIVNGGTSTTIVAGLARLVANIYCFEEKNVDDYIKQIKKIALLVDKKNKTKTEVNILEIYQGAKINLDDQLVIDLKKAYAKYDIKANFTKKLLISSNNTLAEKNISSLNLGMGYEHCHTTQETLYIDEFYKLYLILKNYLFIKFL